MRILYRGEALDRLRRSSARGAGRAHGRATPSNWLGGRDRGDIQCLRANAGLIDILAFHRPPARCWSSRSRPGSRISAACWPRSTERSGSAPRSPQREVGPRRPCRDSSSSATTARADDGSSIHEDTFTTGFPTRCREVSRWLRAPTGPIAGLMFLSICGPQPQTTDIGGQSGPPGTSSKLDEGRRRGHRPVNRHHLRLRAADGGDRTLGDRAMSRRQGSAPEPRADGPGPGRAEPGANRRARADGPGSGSICDLRRAGGA